VAPSLSSSAWHSDEVSSSGPGLGNKEAPAAPIPDPVLEQELLRKQREEDAALEQRWRCEAAAHSAAFERERLAFLDRQRLALEKERAVEQQRQLVVDQAAALETQRQALMLQKQQLQEALRHLEMNRQAAALAQEKRDRAQAAANLRAAAGLARQVAEENAALEDALLERQRQAEEAAAGDHAPGQQPATVAAAEVAHREEGDQAQAAATEADRLAEQQRQLIIEAAIVLAQDAPVGLLTGGAAQPTGQPAGGAGQPTVYQVEFLPGFVTTPSHEAIGLSKKKNFSLSSLSFFLIYSAFFLS